MTFAMFVLAVLPGIALVGPLLVGVAFDSDWVLKAGLGFDVVAIVLGGAACWVVRLSTPTPIGRLGTSMATAVGAGLIVFGLLFGAISIWKFSAEPGD